MIDITRNLPTTVDRALDWIIPAAAPFPMRMAFQETLRGSYSDSDLIAKAQTIYVRQHIDTFVNFYLEMLSLAGIDASWQLFNDAEIFASYGGKDKEMDPRALEVMRNDVSNQSGWLHIHGNTNPRFDTYLINCWKVSKVIVTNKGDYDIQLLPARTTYHLLHLARAISAYFS